LVGTKGNREDEKDNIVSLKKRTHNWRKALIGVRSL